MKKIVPVLVILLLLGIGGYFYMSSKGATPKTPFGSASNSTGGNVFTSIKDALSKSMSLKCVYKDEKGSETTTYIKGGAVRVMVTETGGDDQFGNIVMKDKKMYMWSDKIKQGFTLMIKEPENVSPIPETGNDGVKKGNDQESVLAQIEKYKDACKVEVIADSYFTVPTDVKFQDMDAFQKQMMKGIPTNPPTNDGSSADSQKYLEELMKQITPEAGDGQ